MHPAASRSGVRADMLGCFRACAIARRGLHRSLLPRTRSLSVTARAARESDAQRRSLSKIDIYLNQLNAEQREALTANKKAVRVIAGPGSGKTRVIVARVLHLLRSGVAPSEVMAVTFTNKAANELKERLKTTLTSEAVKRLTAGTFHGICIAILK
jgi:superfamily I DNA and RNA helicase